jgi:carbon starvation protein CstA
MQKLENMTRQHLTVILLLLLLGGFATLLAELLLTNHFGGTQSVAVIASVAGALALLAGFFVKGRVRHVVALLLVVLSISGLLGMRQHAEAASEAYTAPALATNAEGYQTIAAQAGAVESAPQQERPRKESVPPPLAPLSLSGLALMGVVVLLAKQDA